MFGRKFEGAESNCQIEANSSELKIGQSFKDWAQNQRYLVQIRSLGISIFNLFLRPRMQALPQANCKCTEGSSLQNVLFRSGRTSAFSRPFKVPVLLRGFHLSFFLSLTIWDNQQPVHYFSPWTRFFQIWAAMRWAGRGRAKKVRMQVFIFQILLPPFCRYRVSCMGDFLNDYDLHQAGVGQGS